MESARWFAVLARDLAEQPDRDATVLRLLELVTTATGCSAAAIAHLSPQGDLFYGHATDAVLNAEISAISTGTAEGVAWQALHERRMVRVDDLATEQRWPRYTAQMRRRTPVRSALGHCLVVDNLVLGAMLLYSTQPGFFTDDICRFTDVYADHAAIALSRVTEHDRAENLERALDSNRQIGMAIGILMSRYGLTEQAAFDLLRVTSQHRHRKLRDIAAETVFTGELPSDPQAPFQPSAEAN
jgi:transcriptional regulator with GAF, ATPase, and Fis domain